MTAPQTSGVDHPTFLLGFRKLSAAFPASFPDEQATGDRMRLWRELLDAHPWITRPVFLAGVVQIAWRHKGEFVPPPATALDFFREAERALEAQQRRLADQVVPALPAPATIIPSSWQQRTGPERAAYVLRHLAIGKLRARGRPDPTEEELTTVEEEIRTSGFMRRQLERLAAGEPVTPQELQQAVTPVRRRGGWRRVGRRRAATVPLLERLRLRKKYAPPKEGQR